MDLASRASSAVAWALTTRNRRLLAQLLLFLIAGGLSFLTLFTRFTLGRATALRIGEIFRQAGKLVWSELKHAWLPQLLGSLQQQCCQP